MLLNHYDLLRRLDMSDEAAGVFGVCYTVLHWSGIAKGLGPNPASIAHSICKLIETGHATTFIWSKSNDVFIKSHACRYCVAFSTEAWARTTPNATTYVYYIDVDEEFIERYVRVATRMAQSPAAYALLTPNLPGQRYYESCVSVSHHLMAEVGLGSSLMARGFWTPSAANWFNWFSSFAPRTVGGFTWKQRFVPNTNTAVLQVVDNHQSVEVIESLLQTPSASMSRHPNIGMKKNN